MGLRLQSTISLGLRLVACHFVGFAACRLPHFVCFNSDFNDEFDAYFDSHFDDKSDFDDEFYDESDACSEDKFDDQFDDCFEDEFDDEFDEEFDTCFDDMRSCVLTMMIIDDELMHDLMMSGIMF